MDRILLPDPWRHTSARGRVVCVGVYYVGVSVFVCCVSASEYKNLYGTHTCVEGTWTREEEGGGCGERKGTGVWGRSGVGSSRER